MTLPGNIYTVAGRNNLVGDGGPATAAFLYQPVGLALSSSGDLFVADSLNHAIRKVGTNFHIQTIRLAIKLASHP